MLFGQKENTVETTTLFFRQMAPLLTAGISMQDALITLSEGNESQNVEKLITSIIGDTSIANKPKGRLKNYPDYLKKMLRYFIASDSNDDIFQKVLHTIADENEKLDDLKKRVKAALVYPISIIALALVITGIIMVYVIPTFTEIFASFGSALPAPTQFTINISNFVTNNIGILIICFLMIGMILKFNKTVSHSILNILPGIGSLTKNLAIIRFLKYLSLLMTLKVPLQEAIEYASNSVNNVVYAAKFKALKNKVTPDNSLNEILNTTGLFTPMIIRMIKAGEKIDATENIISEVADYYEQKLGSIEKYIQVIDLAIMIFIGTVIGGFIISMYLPIFQMAGAVG